MGHREIKGKNLEGWRQILENTSLPIEKAYKGETDKNSSCPKWKGQLFKPIMFPSAHVPKQMPTDQNEQLRGRVSALS